MIRFHLTTGPYLHADPTMWARILPRFQKEAGEMIVDAVHNLLGTDEIYHLSPGYAAVKPKRPGFRRYPGKAGDQPLILTGSLYEGVTATPTADGVTVAVESSAGVSPTGEDYAEKWEEKTQYLEKALALVEADLANLLLLICVQEMLL